MPDQQKTPDANEVMMQLRYLQNLYSQQYESLDGSIANYTMTNTSLDRNIEILEKSKSVENSNIIIAGEGGAYIPAKLGKVDKIMTYVGGGYLIETNVEKALEFLKANRAKGEEVLTKLVAEKRKVEKDLLDIQYKLNALQYEEQQQQTGS